MSNFKSWGDVVRLWPGSICDILSNDIDIPRGTLTKQVSRNSVQPGLWRPIIDSARRRGIRGVHANSLTDLAYRIQQDKELTNGRPKRL